MILGLSNSKTSMGTHEIFMGNELDILLYETYQVRLSLIKIVYKIYTLRVHIPTQCTQPLAYEFA